MSESLLTALIAVALIAAVVIPYALRTKRREKTAESRLAELQIAGLQAATMMHPHIDALACIGCGSCVAACPEEDVLGVIGGKAVLVHGAKCIGHGLCADACPVGAITLLMASPGRSANLPVLSEEYETSVPGIFIVGELGGMGLIKNAVLQGRRAVDAVATRISPHKGMLDVLIVGAGPAGLASGLSAMERKLRYAVLEQGDVGGTILRYPRRKVVLTSPVDLPVWGRLRFTEATKEQLLETWEKIIRSTGLEVKTDEKMAEIRFVDGMFRVRSSKDEYVTRTVILAMGRRGIPRRLGVPGEELPKVVYQLIDAESFTDMDLLVVGGGDSAIEAAIALAVQKTNRVTLSYRQAEFTKMKERNAVHLREQVRSKRLTLAMNSVVQEIQQHHVILATPGGTMELRNEQVFICAGGELPFAQLTEMGIQFHQQLLADTHSA
jgi:thioredoxin reductase/Pyruvate/2-oxoacid:ferredoxin oxidoreductase delta subunit